MRRVQLEIDDDLASYLERRSGGTGEGVVTAILDMVGAQRAADERQRRIEIALAALDKPPFHSGVADLARHHDADLGQILDEEVERWRRR